MAAAFGADEVRAFERCIREGGVAIFPADTVYGLACDPDSASAIERMYALKGRAPDKPSAVMFFSFERALEALPGIGELTRAALHRMLPGPVTVVLENPAGRFALATSGSGLGIRVPRLTGRLAPLTGVRVSVLQTSANLTGGPDPRSPGDVPAGVREAVDIVLDAGELEGTPSTVVDLTHYERDGEWHLLRETAVSRRELQEILS